MARQRDQINKPHKSKFSSKSSRNAHKTSFTDKTRIAKPVSNSKGKRAARIQHNKMIREQKRISVLQEKKYLAGSSSPPRVIVLVALAEHVNLSALAEAMFSLMLGSSSTTPSPVVSSQDYKLRVTILKAPHGNLVSCLDMGKVADLIIFVASTSSHCEGTCSRFIDSFGSQCLSALRAIGLPSTAVLIRDLPLEKKRAHDLKKACVSSLAPEFPEDCRFYPADTRDDLHKFLWQFREQRLSVPQWRSQRPYVMSQKLEVVADASASGSCTLVVSGYVRACPFSVNQLVHVSDLGDFRLSKIEILRDPFPLNSDKLSDPMDHDDDDDVIESFLPDPVKQEPLLSENVPDPIVGEQTWPTDAEMAEADNVKKRLKNESLNQGSGSGSAMDDDGDGDGETVAAYDDEIENGSSDIETDDGRASLLTTGSVFSETMDDEDLTTEQIQESIRKIREEHDQDRVFPDEVETPVDVPARRRFGKYRGLKSFRTSPWDPKESLPPEYARIFTFGDFLRTHKRVKSVSGAGDAWPGAYVRLHVSGVPPGVTVPSAAVVCGLLRHESKMSVLHLSVRNGGDDPVKSKEELTFHVGFRKFSARPVFSSDDLNCDKHKMERFLHPGRFSIASVFAPVSFPPLPAVAVSGKGAVAALGSLRSVDPDRITLKRIVLTGHLHRVSKQKAVVRYMFHGPADVRWFKPVDVSTKSGRRGRIRDSVGTHGAMKCVFDGVVQQHDTVCMSLYKRVYPKWPQTVYPS